MIEIRNGCTKEVSGTITDTYKYVDARATGIITVYFTVAVGVIPKIGDFISDDFQLIPRTEPKIVPSERDRFRDDDKQYTYRR